MRGTTLQSGIDPQDLVDLATIGAEKIIDGAIAFHDWAKQMRDDIGDLIDFIAKQSNQTADAVLERVHKYSTATSKAAPTIETKGQPGGTTLTSGTQDRPSLGGELPETGKGTEEGGNAPSARRERGREEREGDGREPGAGPPVVPGPRAGDGGVEKSPVLVTPLAIGPQNVSDTRSERDYRIPDNRKVGGTPEKRFENNMEAIRLLNSKERIAYRVRRNRTYSVDM